MARKRKTTRRKTTHRRRKMSGMGKLDAGNILSTVGGIAAGTLVAGLLVKKLLSTQNELVQAIVPVAAGIATPMFVKSNLGQMAGAGMVGYGVAKLLAKYNLAGVGEVDTIDVPMSISGDDNLSVISGDDDYAMAGYDDFAMAGDDISVLAGLEG
jgi:hypothetical protein